jgi:hypothetical protein
MSKLHPISRAAADKTKRHTLASADPYVTCSVCNQRYNASHLEAAIYHRTKAHEPQQ